MNQRFYLKERRETVEYLISPVLPSGFFTPQKKAVQNGKLNGDTSRDFRCGNRDVGSGGLHRDDANQKV